MSKKIRWITETAVMLALLVCLQWVGSFVPDQMTKQLITGTLVNCVLAVTVLMVGLSSSELSDSQAVDEQRIVIKFKTADREILHTSQCLYAIKSISRNFKRTYKVTFNAELI